MSAKIQSHPLYRSRKGGWRLFFARLERFEHDVYEVGVYTSERLALDDGVAAKRYLFNKGDPNADLYNVRVIPWSVQTTGNPLYEYNP